jgi:hypothetical protein
LVTTWRVAERASGQFSKTGWPERHIDRHLVDTPFPTLGTVCQEDEQSGGIASNEILPEATSMAECRLVSRTFWEVSYLAVTASSAFVPGAADLASMI